MRKINLKTEKTRIKLLIIEDNPVIATTTAQLLSILDMDIVLLKKNFENAYSVIDNEKPDLIILDVDLGSRLMDGFSIAEYIAESKKIPFLFISAFCQDEILEQIACTKALGYLNKPFKRADLVTNIKLAVCQYCSEKVLLGKQRLKIPSNIPLLLRGMLDYIDANIKGAINIKEMSVIMNQSKYKLDAMSEKYYGISLSKLILRRRIYKALSIMEGEDIFLMKVSEEVGFTTYSSFFKNFKHIVGVSPELFVKNFQRREYEEEGGIG